MKKFAIILAAAALLTSNTGFAQTRNTGSAATAGTYNAANFAWGIGLAGLVVIGVVVGVTAGAAASSQSTFSH